MKKELNKYISLLPTVCDSIIGIQLELSENSLLCAFQTYLPSKGHRVDEFTNYLDLLYGILDTYSQKGMVVIMADMNCHVNSSAFSKQLDSRNLKFRRFLDLSDMTAVNSLCLCQGAKASYISANVVA